MPYNRLVAFSSVAESKDVSLFGILAFSGLSGMFSKQAIEWLRRIFDQMFRQVRSVTWTNRQRDHRHALGNKVSFLLDRSILPR